MRVVLDTNVLISAIFWGGTPLKILNLWIENKIEVVISKEIFEEYIGIISRISDDKDQWAQLHFRSLRF